MKKLCMMFKNDCMNNHYGDLSNCPSNVTADLV